MNSPLSLNSPHALVDPSPRVAHHRLSDAAGSLVDALGTAARLAGLPKGLLPWQTHVAEVVTSVDADGRWLHPEAAVVVARQNGKTTFITPRVITGLTRGEHIVHVAHDRARPAETFLEVADIFERVPSLKSLLAAKPARARGFERLKTVTGGDYHIYSSQRDAIRGTQAVDLLIIDEVRMFTDHAFMAAAVPTTLTSNNPQILYLSNAGHAASVILNDLRARGLEHAPDLAYLEYSVPETADIDDESLWHLANPSLGHTVTLDRLRQLRRSMPPGDFDAEHLCRWVTTAEQLLVEADQWERCTVDELPPGTRPALGVAVDPETGRVSAVVAWMTPTGDVAVDLAAEADSSDLETLAAKIVTRARDVGVTVVGFNPWTDQDLIRHINHKMSTKKITGQELSSAAALFADTVTRRRLAHVGNDTLTLDIGWLTRKTRPDGTFTPQRRSRPVTSALAAVTAVWLATNPTPNARVW